MVRCVGRRGEKEQRRYIEVELRSAKEMSWKKDAHKAMCLNSTEKKNWYKSMKKKVA